MTIPISIRYFRLQRKPALWNLDRWVHTEGNSPDQLTCQRHNWLEYTSGHFNKLLESVSRLGCKWKITWRLQSEVGFWYRPTTDAHRKNNFNKIFSCLWQGKEKITTSKCMQNVPYYHCLFFSEKMTLPESYLTWEKSIPLTLYFL